MKKVIISILSIVLMSSIVPSVQANQQVEAKPEWSTTMGLGIKAIFFLGTGIGVWVASKKGMKLTELATNTFKKANETGSSAWESTWKNVTTDNAKDCLGFITDKIKAFYDTGIGKITIGAGLIGSFGLLAYKYRPSQELVIKN